MHEFRLPPRADDTAHATPASEREAEVWTVCRVFRRNFTYKKHPQQQQQQQMAAGGSEVSAGAGAATVAQPGESSSVTGGVESDTGDEYTNTIR